MLLITPALKRRMIKLTRISGYNEEGENICLLFVKGSEKKKKETATFIKKNILAHEEICGIPL